MSASVMSGELRASKGALLFLPAGSKRMLRVESEVGLDPGFRKGAVQLRLVQAAKGAVPMPKLPLSLEPEHGVPTRVVGEVEAQEGARLRLRTVDDICLEVQLPSESRAFEGRVLCELEPRLEAHGLQLG